MVRMVELYPKSKAIKEDIADAFVRVFASGRYIGGPEVTAFEEEWADYCGAKYCVGVSSGFAALQLVVRALEMPKVYYSTMTCMPTVLAIEEAGADPIPVCPLEPYYTLKPFQLAEDHLNVLVNLYGIVDPHVIEHSDKGCPIVEDAAQAHGSLHKMCNRAAYTTAATWSFYPTKNLGALGDAGAVTTNSEGLARVVRGLSNYKGRGGVNARMDPLQAAILRAKLPYLDSHNHRRAANAAIYLERLKGLPLRLPYDCLTNWHQFPIIYAERDYLIDWLRSHGIGTQVHYGRPALLGMRETVPCGEPWDEKWSKSVLSLPIGPHLNEADILFVTEVISAYFERD